MVTTPFARLTIPQSPQPPGPAHSPDPTPPSPLPLPITLPPTSAALQTLATYRSQALPGPAVRRTTHLDLTSHVSPEQLRDPLPRYFNSHPYHGLRLFPNCLFPTSPDPTPPPAAVCLFRPKTSNLSSDAMIICNLSSVLCNGFFFSKNTLSLPFSSISLSLSLPVSNKSFN